MQRRARVSKLGSNVTVEPIFVGGTNKLSVGGRNIFLCVSQISLQHRSAPGRGYSLKTLTALHFYKKKHFDQTTPLCLDS